MIFVLLACLVVAAIVYTYFYVGHVREQRKELYERYMGVLQEKEKDRGVADKGERQGGMSPSLSGRSPEDTAFMKRVMNYIQENIGNSEADVEKMAMATAASKSTLSRRLRSLMGVSPNQLLIQARMQHAIQLLAQRSETGIGIHEIAEKCGYENVQYFRRVFKKNFNVNPEEYDDNRTDD